MSMGFPFMLVALPLALLVYLLPVALVIFLQVFLCRRGKWLGLILPGISLGISLLLVLNMAAFATITRGPLIGGGSNQVTMWDEENETWVNVGEVQTQNEVTAQDIAQTVGLVAGVFLLTNIPTAILGGIWLYHRRRWVPPQDFKKMNIEDLE